MKNLQQLKQSKQSRQVSRLCTLSAHLTSGTFASESGPTAVESSKVYHDIPDVKAGPEILSDPFHYLSKLSKEYPDLFYLQRGKGFKYIVVSDVSIYEDVLTFEDVFGTPQSDVMPVQQNVFQITPEETKIARNKVPGELRKFLLHNALPLATKISENVGDYVKKEMNPSISKVDDISGVMDIRDFGEVIFWPMTEALLGPKTSKSAAPSLYKTFEDIDNSFGKALRGKVVPEVRDGVRAANQLFAEAVEASKKDPVGCPMAPLTGFYDKGKFMKHFICAQ